MIGCFFSEAFFFGAGRPTHLIVWPTSSLRVGPPVFVLEPRMEVMGRSVGGLEPEVAVLEPKVVALEPKVAALETEVMQPCLALPRHHPQHYGMLVTTCETKEVYE